ncbi:MAG: PIN domain-containing protein [Puniceicoccaceae bacterium]|nr:MAG: PIN domain-containing protein [Puniceicoccaceae bacterium]
MILPDLNLLLYAYNHYAPQHAKAKVWWEEALNGRELIGLPHEVMLGFVRIATNPRLGEAAVSFANAKAVIEKWQQVSVVRVLLPSEDHSQQVLSLMERSGVSGQLTSDASLAVYAMENRARLCSNDADFVRFPGLSWENPLL